MNLRKSIKKLGLSLTCLGLLGGFTASTAQAISEKDYQVQFQSVVLPFLRSGKEINFVTTDGLQLSGVRFLHPDAKGTILLLPGRSEPWLKYGEVFYDLYQQGFSIFALDHRGQGLSPHLAPKNSQIGHINHFEDYISDLDGFIEKVVKPELRDAPLYLLAHSMGAAIATGYLETHASPFKSVALVSPMLQIDTKPYSEPVALTIVSALTKIGKGRQYAIGKGDFDPFLPFEKNDVTGSPDRFWMTNEIYSRYPSTIIGGPSNGWVYRSLVASKKIAKGMKSIKTPILMFQAGADQIVKTARQNSGCALAAHCELVTYSKAQHEILMEMDSIRDSAFAKILAFFK